MFVLSVLSDVTNLGAAGLIGAMWLAERRLSRQRDEQLTASHERIVRDEQRLEMLTKVIEQNTAAIATFTESQRQTCETIKHLLEEFQHVNAR